MPNPYLVVIKHSFNRRCALIVVVLATTVGQVIFFEHRLCPAIATTKPSRVCLESSDLVYSWPDLHLKRRQLNVLDDLEVDNVSFTCSMCNFQNFLYFLLLFNMLLYRIINRKIRAFERWRVRSWVIKKLCVTSRYVSNFVYTSLSKIKFAPSTYCAYISFSFHTHHLLDKISQWVVTSR